MTAEPADRGARRATVRLGRPAVRRGLAPSLRGLYLRPAWTACRQFQYRAANYMYMIGMVVEPVVYLVVWSTVAEPVGRRRSAAITPATFAAYYIVWTLVRNMNIVFTPYGWEERIREGRFVPLLLRPMHPVHYDLGFFAGWKVVVIVLWIPIAVVLSLTSTRRCIPTLEQGVVFFVAIWGALPAPLAAAVGARHGHVLDDPGSALFELYFTAELLLSGRLVPLALLPAWAAGIADLLPFRWTFGYPIDALAGSSTVPSCPVGLGFQAAWVRRLALVAAGLARAASAGSGRWAAR